MGLEALCDALAGAGAHFERLVFQSMRDKTLDPAILKRLQSLADEVVIPRLGLERACDPAELAARFGSKARVAACVADALADGLAADGTILLCGSLYLAGAYYELYPEHLEL